MKTMLFLILVLASSLAFGQEELFPYGQVTYREMGISSYPKDTNAVALMLKETGYSYIDSDNKFNLVYRYYARIKILRPQGTELADVVIPIYKQNGNSDFLRTVKASSWNIENGSLVETKLNTRHVFTENYKNGDLKKFAIPNVKVGSVIEYEFELETPFYYMNFKPWEFQSSIPKLESEYWALIPANFKYNIALRGFQKLKKNESEVLKGWFRVGGGVADCVRYKWSMEEIPAFVEEEYMTSKKNFLSSIRFELIQFQSFSGSKDKITKEWRDADQELRTHEHFGVQLKKGKDVMTPELQAELASSTSLLDKARTIHTFVQRWYRWNGDNDMFSDNGIKKAFDKRIAGAADINLTMIALMRHAGIEVDPLILSTRDNGWPTDLYPVLTEFNYVVAKVDVDGRSYLVDATEDFLPFGMLPSKCLNGRGRVLAKGGSSWYEIKPVDKAKKLTTLSLTLSACGELVGSVQTTYMGYEAVRKRSEIYAHPSLDGYIESRKTKWTNGHLKDVTIANLDDLAKPVVEKLEIELEPIQLGPTTLVRPYASERVLVNPFRSVERLYPVDFGTAVEETMVINLTLPEGYGLDEIPERVGLALPNNGGRFIFDVKQNGQVVTLNSLLAITRTIFHSEEYHYLKELYNKVISINRMDLVVKRI